jgi:ribose transport system substrate-binding protein
VSNAKLGFITFNFQAQFFNDLAAGVKEAATKAGAEVTALDPQSKPETQVKMMEDLITQKVSAIIIIAADPQGLGPTVQKAADAKIPVIGVDAIIDNPLVTANVGTANRDASKQLGDYAVKWLKDNKAGKANMGIVFATTPIQIERKDGFKEAIAALPDVKILQEVSTQNTLEAATAGVENLIQANPNMDTIFVTSELAVQGSLASLESRGTLGKVPIFGWDVTPPFLDAVVAGNVIGLVQQQPKEEGRLAVESALKVLSGGTVPKLIPVPVVLVTKDNVQDVKKSLGG